MNVEQALLSFAVIAALLTIVPGLDTVLVLRAAISQGRKHAYATAIGVNTGALIWGVAAALGASAVLATSAVAFTALKLAGAAYLVWLGASMLWRSFRNAPVTSAAVPGAATGRDSLLASWAKGAGTNLLNPKVGVFYVAMIPQFIPDGSSPLLMGAALAMVHNLLGLAWFSLIIMGTHVARAQLQRPGFVRITDRVSGAALIGFGATLAFKGR
ncbi:LysE family translocator [Zhihengliuella halotolerans]|uniref:Threonine/homoserine/homoserine lactone efflux protein n=1 Tax=Zhihengliuella halotolerans TaxID=370736 RepID=A0A4Q8AF16_9MICC|nr:LysE family translocator [Zhihengliuella halotolerans]RZU62838.1 threonine/homoserine/homoserine lactone efflux protein [Zhihengliuella halotolerans]